MGYELGLVMAMVVRQCWKCDICGFEWIKNKGIIPLQCPSSFCRSRKWNRKENKELLDARWNAKLASERRITA